MKYCYHRLLILLSLPILVVSARADAIDKSPPSAANSRYITIISQHISADYKGMFRDKGGAFEYPFITPGSQQYADVLWDWDSWLTDIALRQELLDHGSPEERQQAVEYERGCILNFLNFGGMDGWIPINIHRNSGDRAARIKGVNIYDTNMHKPCLAQHAAFLVQLDNGNAEWLREKFYYLQTFVNKYKSHERNKATGLYFWNDDAGIGVDNDPATYRRPPKSSGSIFLNCMMYKELLATVYLCQRLDLGELAVEYQRDADELKASIQKNCWDERDGFFYSVDLNLLPLEIKTGAGSTMPLHAGHPPDYDCLIQRLGVWSGFLALWAGIATPEQAQRMVHEHLENAQTFAAAYGVRSLSKMEKMYSLRASGNPSLWTGPIWGVANYLVFSGLVKYGYNAQARELADKTIQLFGRDFERAGALHEYYLPDSGEPVLNRGFQDWNYLVLNMIAWREDRARICEF